MAFELAAANPYAAGAQAAGQALQTALAGANSSANDAAVKNVFDHSGWNVNFGSGEITSERRQTEAPEAALQGIAQFLPLIGLAVAGLIAWKMLQAYKKK